MQDIKARVDEFKKMAAFADQLEDAGDDRRARAVRIALYDRVMDTTKVVEAEIERRFGSVDNMVKVAQNQDEGMERDASWAGAAKWLGGIWDKLKGFGKGLGRAIGTGEIDPAVAKKLPKSFVSKVGSEAFGPGGEAIPGQLSNLGRGLAVGVPAALAGGGAAALAGRGRGPEQRPGEGIAFRGGPGDYPGKYGGPATLPPSGMPIGAGGYGGGPIGAGGYGGMSGGSSDISQAMSALQGVQSQIAQLEARVSRLEGVGR